MIKEIQPSLEKIPLLALYFSSACENYISYFSEICKIFQKMGLLHEYWPWKIMFSNLAPRYNKLWFISIFEAVTWGHIWNSSDLYFYQNIHLHTFSNLPNKVIDPYLRFVIFFTRAKFLENKIYSEKCVNYDKIHSKLPFFCVITAKYTVNCQFFALNL